MADEHDLGSCAARRGGSNPPFPTTGDRFRTFYPSHDKSKWRIKIYFSDLATFYTKSLKNSLTQQALLVKIPPHQTGSTIQWKVEELSRSQLSPKSSKEMSSSITSRCRFLSILSSLAKRAAAFFSFCLDFSVMVILLKTPESWASMFLVL